MDCPYCGGPMEAGWIPGTDRILRVAWIPETAERRFLLTRTMLTESGGLILQDRPFPAAPYKQVLAVGKVVAEYVHIDMFAHLSALFYYRGNHAYGLSAAVVGGFCHALHESHVASSEHEGVSFRCHPRTQFARTLKVFVRQTVVCRAENTYFHSLFFCSFISGQDCPAKA